MKRLDCLAVKTYFKKKILWYFNGMVVQLEEHLGSDSICGRKLE